MKKVLLTLAFVGLIASVILFLALIVAFSGPGKPRGPLVLTWDLDGSLPEAAAEASRLLPAGPADLTFGEAYSALRRARQDPKVERLAIYFRSPLFGLAKAEEIRRQMASIQQAGKDVICYLEAAGEGTNGTLLYFLASGCDSLALAPGGEINLLGLYAEGLFLRSTLDKLRITPDFTSAGIYKSAIETYTRTDRSDAAEEAVAAILDHDLETITAAISERRAISREQVLRLVHRGLFGAQEALEEGLVDELLFPDEFAAKTDTRDSKHLTRITLQDYAAGPQAGQNKVAVVFASGVIMRGDSTSESFLGERTLGSDDFVELLDQVSSDDSIDAVVLRVDSPGGSALASDLILRGLDRLAKSKPLVASLSDVAASGGYYIVSHAPTIVAESTTLTGSIGVYSGKLVTGRLEHELLGIGRDPIKRGNNADLYSTSSPFSDEQSRLMQARVDQIYEAFLSHVAKGRQMTRDQVHAVAQGRVWSGKHALDHNLVDHLGGLDQAIDLAARAAGIEPSKTRLVFLPEPPTILELLASLRHSAASLRLNALQQQLLPRAPAALELPRELVRLSQPY